MCTTRTSYQNPSTPLQAQRLYHFAPDTKTTPLTPGTQLLTYLPCRHPKQVRKPPVVVKLDLRDPATFCSFPDLQETHRDSGTHASTHRSRAKSFRQ